MCRSTGSHLRHVNLCLSLFRPLQQFPVFARRDTPATAEIRRWKTSGATNGAYNVDFGHMSEMKTFWDLIFFFVIEQFWCFRDTVRFIKTGGAARAFFIFRVPCFERVEYSFEGRD